MHTSNNLFDYSKKLIIKLLIIFGLILNPIFLINSANAATVGGWTMSNPIAQGASTVYDATKTVLINGKNVVKTSSIAIAPTAAEVAKVLARGGATLALTVAVEQLLGAVDWVLDPANNQIVYYPVDQPINTYPKVWDYKVVINGSSVTRYATSSAAACSALSAYYISINVNRTVKSVTTFSTYAECRYYEVSNVDKSYYVSNPAYDPNAQSEKKTLPLSTVAAQVISNADGNTDKKAGAQVATMAAAADIVAEAESDDTKAPPIATQLDKNASTATDETSTGTATQTDPTTGETKTTDLSLEFPSFCGWAPTVCEAAQTVISFPQTLTNWWETGTKAVSETWVAVKEWAKEETPEKENTELQIDETPTPVNQVNASFGDNICPSMSIPFHIPNSTITVDLTPTKLCEIASGVQGFVIALGFYHASRIVGRRT